MLLSPDEAAAFGLIRAAGKLMRAVDDLAGASTAEAVRALLDAGLAVLWVPAGPCDVAELAAAGLVRRGTPDDAVLVTLTPWGAQVARRMPREKWEGRPQWGRIPTDDDGEDDVQLADPPRLAPPSKSPPKPAPLKQPGRVTEAEGREHVYLRDEWTGEKVELFSGGEPGRGWHVEIDPRLGRGPRRAG